MPRAAGLEVRLPVVGVGGRPPAGMRAAKTHLLVLACWHSRRCCFKNDLLLQSQMPAVAHWSPWLIGRPGSRRCSSLAPGTPRSKLSRAVLCLANQTENRALKV